MPTRPSRSATLLVADVREFKDKPAQVAAMHPDTMTSLSIEMGDLVLVEGKPRHKVVLVCGPSTTTPRNQIELHLITRNNLRLEIGDSVVVLPCPSNQVGNSIRILPLENYETAGSNMEQSVKEYFNEAAQMKLPFHEGNTILVGDNMRFKIAATDPAGFCTTTEETRVELGFSESYWSIGGCKPQIEQLREWVEVPLRQLELVEDIGARHPHGILMVGPHGTGKRRLARAVASHAGATFITVDGPEIKRNLDGDGEKDLRDAFRQAEALNGAPAIIFIDEIDCIAPKDTMTNIVESGIVAQLLIFLDTVQGHSNIVIMASTTRLCAIDPALRRIGRFDKNVVFGIPDREGRLEILTIHTRTMRLDDGVKSQLSKVAEQTHGYIAADIAALCNAAAMHNLRRIIGLQSDSVSASLRDSLRVSMEDFRFALGSCPPSVLPGPVVETPEDKWIDMAGMDGIIRELQQALPYHNENSEGVKKIGVPPSRGVLLGGPEGMGKSLLARAAAHECGANFISLKGSQLLYMGLGEPDTASIRDVFDTARAAAPCIVFLDELEAFAKPQASGAKEVRDGDGGDRLLNVLLAEMDGLNVNNNIFVIGATTRPGQVDPTCLRAGRFDRLISVALPDEAARLSIIKAIVSRNVSGSTDNIDGVSNRDLRWLAGKTPGCSGADLTEIVHRAFTASMHGGVQGDRKEGGVVVGNRALITRENLKEAVKKARCSVSREATGLHERKSKISRTSSIKLRWRFKL